jgi:hypothetical protein
MFDALFSCRRNDRQRCVIARRSSSSSSSGCTTLLFCFIDTTDDYDDNDGYAILNVVSHHGHNLFCRACPDCITHSSFRPANAAVAAMLLRPSSSPRCDARPCTHPVSATADHASSNYDKINPRGKPVRLRIAASGDGGGQPTTANPESEAARLTDGRTDVATT